MAAPTPALHEALLHAASSLSTQRVEALFDDGSDRAQQYRCSAAGLTLDFSKHLLDDSAWQRLLELADGRELPQAFSALIGGELINSSEQRPALHTLLRGTANSQHLEKSQDVQSTLTRMKDLVDAIHSGQSTGCTGKRFTDVINLGIGGSDLGPRLVYDALKDIDAPVRVHFVANIDPEDLDRTLAPLDPETTLVVICSKSFSTEETLCNAKRASEWLRSVAAPGEALGRHLIAVTTQVSQAGEWHIPPERCFPLWDWVGGRFSLWSVIGLPIALAIGFDNFQAMLRGAGEMDTHFATAKAEDNLPLNLALLSYWYRQFFDSASTAVVPYSEDLSLFPSYLQQLYMESLGKSVSREGAPLNLRSSEVIWGSAGTNGQHSYFQQLHQGTELIPVEFIALASPSTTRLTQGQGQGESENEKGSERDSGAEQQAMLLANCLSQSWALMRGDDGSGDPHRNIPGNRPSTTLLLDSLTPASLGMLIALYEHRVFALSVLWHINAFDQWGVELGKRLAQQVLTALESQPSSAALDPSTAQLIARIRASRAGKK